MKWNGVAAVVNLIAKQLKTADSALMRQRTMTSTTAGKNARFTRVALTYFTLQKKREDLGVS